MFKWRRIKTEVNGMIIEFLVGFLFGYIITKELKARITG